MTNEENDDDKPGRVRPFLPQKLHLFPSLAPFSQLPSLLVNLCYFTSFFIIPHNLQLFPSLAPFSQLFTSGHSFFHINLSFIAILVSSSILSLFFSLSLCSSLIPFLSFGHLSCLCLLCGSFSIPFTNFLGCIHQTSLKTCLAFFHPFS